MRKEGEVRESISPIYSLCPLSQDRERARRERPERGYREKGSGRGGHLYGARPPPLCEALLRLLLLSFGPVPGMLMPLNLNGHFI